MRARTLVIEDNPVNQELFVCLLRAAGHVAIRASSGEAGLHAARYEQPNLIVCDVSLPGINGREVVQQLKLDAITRLIPVVAVTAHAMGSDRDGALAAGFDGYITKPIDPRTFVSQLERFLSKKCAESLNRPLGSKAARWKAPAPAGLANRRLPDRTTA